MSDNKQPQISTLAIAWIPAIAIGFSTIYLYWFSIGSGIPILSMMTPNDFISATLPFFLPTLIISVFGLILAISSNLAAVRATESYPEGKNLKHKWKKAPYSVKYATVVVLFLAISISILGLHLNSVMLMFLVIYNLSLDFFPENRILKLTRKAVDSIGFIGFLLPLIIPALLLISVNGYTHGRSGRLPFSPNKSLDVELDSGETISGSFSFCAGKFSLFYSATNGVATPVLLKTDDISRISTKIQEPNQSSELTSQPPSEVPEK
jgi:hypothetical protein